MARSRRLALLATCVLVLHHGTAAEMSVEDEAGELLPWPQGAPKWPSVMLRTAERCLGVIISAHELPDWAADVGLPSREMLGYRLVSVGY